MGEMTVGMGMSACMVTKKSSNQSIHDSSDTHTYCNILFMGTCWGPIDKSPVSGFI